MQGFSLHIQQSWIRYILPSYQAQLLGFHSFLQLFAILPAVFALGGHPRGVCHVASRSTRFQNPLDFNWISDFRSEFWISKWISEFQSRFLDSIESPLFVLMKIPLKYIMINEPHFSQS